MPNRNPSSKHPAQPVLPDDILTELLEAGPSAGADAGAAESLARARSALMRRVAETGASAGATRTVRAADGAWQRYGRGVERLVMVDTGTHHTWLLRLAPGASLSAHDHEHGDEESFVLDGSCALNGEMLHAGDFHFAARGSRHERLVSETGCLLWLRMPAHQALALTPPAPRPIR